jgi:taurine dioxygenase
MASRAPAYSSSFDLRPLTGAVGAELTNLDLRAVLRSSQAADEIRQAFHKHAVLVFRNQAGLGEADLLGIAELFGEAEPRPVVKAEIYGLPTVHELVREPGKLGHYGEVWHQDCSYMRHPPLGALLYGVEVPAYGNDTVFCNMELVLQTLSPAFAAMLAPLRAVHSAFKMVQKDPTATYLDYDNVDHPVIRTHPRTGAPSLFVNPFFTKRFMGMTEEESRPILQHLFEIMTRSELQCRVRWENDTLVLWDNRCVAHQAIRDNTRERRVMRRVEIRGDLPR